MGEKGGGGVEKHQSLGPVHFNNTYNSSRGTEGDRTKNMICLSVQTWTMCFFCELLNDTRGAGLNKC